MHALPANKSASTLEAQPAPSILSALPSSSVAGPSKPSAAQPTQPATHEAKTKAPRPSRLSKNYIPGVTPPPDPERWLKKRERTSHLHASTRRGKYNRSGPGGAGMGVGATQGVGVGGGSDLGTVVGNVRGVSPAFGGAGTGHLPQTSAKKGKKK